MNLTSIKIVLRDGREASVMPFSIDAMERIEEAKALEAVTSEDPKARFAAIRLLAYEAICESVPDVTRDNVGSMLTMQGYHQITDAIALANGWRALSAKEAGPQGEAGSPST